MANRKHCAKYGALRLTLDQVRPGSSPGGAAETRRKAGFSLSGGQFAAGFVADGQGCRMVEISPFHR